MADDDEPGRLRAALRRSRIPERFWTADQAKVKGDARWLTTALGNVEGWADQGYGFYIHGPFNTGKSAAAAILAMEFVRRCHAVLWLHVSEIPAVRFHEGALAELDDRLHQVDLLVIDDLGAERFRLDSAAGAALEEVSRIVYGRGRSTVYTSNRAWSEFPVTYAQMPGFVSLVGRLTIPVAMTAGWPDAPSIGGMR